MTVIMFVFASGVYFYCVNENVSLVLSAATPCCVKRGELQYICKQNSKLCYHIFYVQQIQDLLWGFNPSLLSDDISTHSVQWNLTLPAANGDNNERRKAGVGGSSPAEFTCEQPVRRAQQELLWMIMAVFFSNNFFFTFTSALSTLYIFSKRHHKTDLHPKRRKRQKQTGRGIEGGGKACETLQLSAWIWLFGC